MCSWVSNWITQVGDITTSSEKDLCSSLRFTKYFLYIHLNLKATKVRLWFSNQFKLKRRTLVFQSQRLYPHILTNHLKNQGKWIIWVQRLCLILSSIFSHWHLICSLKKAYEWMVNEWQRAPLSMVGIKIKMHSPCYRRPLASLNCKSDWLVANVMSYRSVCWTQELGGRWTSGNSFALEPERHNSLCVSPELFSVHILYSSCESTFSAPQDHLVK